MWTTEDLTRQCGGLPVAPGNKDTGDCARLVLLEPSFSVLYQLSTDSHRHGHGFKFRKLRVAKKKLSQCVASRVNFQRGFFVRKRNRVTQWCASDGLMGHDLVWLIFKQFRRQSVFVFPLLQKQKRHKKKKSLHALRHALFRLKL